MERIRGQQNKATSMVLGQIRDEYANRWGLLGERADAKQEFRQGIQPAQQKVNELLTQLREQSFGRQETFTPEESAQQVAQSRLNQPGVLQRFGNTLSDTTGNLVRQTVEGTQNILTPPRVQQGIDRPPEFGGRPDVRVDTSRQAEGVRQLTTSAVPESSLEDIGGVPVIGEHLRRQVEFGTSPLGVAALGAGVGTAGVGPTLRGVAGEFGLGAAGRALETQGGVGTVDVGPLSIGPRGAGEVVGGALAGTSGIRRPASAVDDTPIPTLRQAEADFDTALRAPPGEDLGRAAAAKFQGELNLSGELLRQELRQADDIARSSGLSLSRNEWTDDARALVDALENRGVYTPEPGHIYRGVNSATEGRRSAWWTSDFERAKAYAQAQGDNPRVIVARESDVPSELLGSGGFKGAEEEVLRLTNQEGFYLPREYADLPVVREVPIGAEGAVSGTINPRAQPLVDRLRAALDDEMATMLEVDPNFRSQALEDYFPHLFKKVEADPRVNVGGRPRGSTTRPGFTFSRRQEGSFSDVLARRPDLEPVVKNPVDMVWLRISEGVKYRAAIRMRDRLEGAGLAVPKSQAPDDWVVPDAAIFRGNNRISLKNLEGTTPEEMAIRMRERAADLEAKAGALDVSDLDLVGGRTVREDLAVAPEHAKFFNDYFSKSWFSKNPIANAARTGVASAKMLKVFGGLFQHFDYTTRQMAGVGMDIPGLNARGIKATGRAWARGFVPSLDAKMAKMDLADPVRRRLIQEGLQLEGGLDIVEREFRDLMTEPGFLARSGVTENIAAKRVKGAVDFISSGAYLKAHREHIMSYAEQLTKNHMKAGDTLEIAAAKAIRQANENFSSLPRWQSIFHDATTRDAMRTALFSPNEAESWVRNFFRPFTGPNRLQAARFYAGIIGTTAMWANILHFIAEGEPLPLDRYNPVSDSGSMGMPIGYNTRFLRPNAPWKGPLGQDNYIDILGQADTPVRWALDPVFGTQSRLGQLPRLAVDTAPLLTGQQVRNFSGEPITGVEEGALYAAEQVAPLPAQAFMSERGKLGDVGSGVQAAGINISSQPLNEYLRQRYEEITGQKWNNDTGYLEARTIPELKPILDEIERRALERESPNAVARAEREAFITEQEQELQLPGKAKAVERNLPGAGEAFREGFRDLQQAAAIAAKRDFFGNDEREMETPEGQSFRLWADLAPENYRDSNFEVDWGKYFTEKDRLFQKLTPRLQQYIEERTTGKSAEVLAVEPRYREALEEYGQWAEIPKYKGLSRAEGDMVDEITRAVMYVRLSSGDPENMSGWDAFQSIRGSFSQKIEDWYEENIVSRPKQRRSGLGGGLGGSLGDRHEAKKEPVQDPRRDEFLLKHTDLMYFGLVSPSQLPLEMRAELPDYILSGGVDLNITSQTGQVAGVGQ